MTQIRMLLVWSLLAIGLATLLRIGMSRLLIFVRRRLRK